MFETTATAATCYAKITSGVDVKELGKIIELETKKIIAKIKRLNQERLKKQVYTLWYVHLKIF